MRTYFDQVIAVEGTLLLTSNMVMVRDGMLQEWFERHHNEWPGVQARQLVQRVDELFCRWWRHRRGPEVLHEPLWRLSGRRIRAPPRSLCGNTRKAVWKQWLGATSPGSRRRCASIFSALRDVAEQIEVVRRNLPHRTRQAEAERRAVIEAHPSIGHEAADRPVAEHESGRYHW